METLEEILRRHEDRAIVRHYVHRQAQATSAADRQARWQQSMEMLARARRMRAHARIEPAGARPSVASSLERLAEVRARIRPNR
jgi:hypothetical protein